ncbi:coiled-coil domain-containing protein [Nitrogeniibacter aestuarii]|uniref:hypothetical protein n=1 Tax=Nitrogeniibacter aestuarii TaxID=2815343 RepID=UPI001D11738B|nr:hypothetical protein [Nitrogeniibacter aestuarii]
MFGKRPDTTELSTQAIVLSDARKGRQWLIAIFMIGSLAALGYMGLSYLERMYSPAARVEELEQENARLSTQLESTQNELEKLRLNGDMERATQTELQNQIKSLDAELSKLREELNFFKKTKPKPSS